MLRLQDNGGWWLVTHPDHAELAGRFAEQWGNAVFLAPEPRADVLAGIFHHDDGWRARDAAPQITRAGLPSAFSRELVGKYSAFEEIDLAAYLGRAPPGRRRDGRRESLRGGARFHAHLRFAEHAGGPRHHRPGRPAEARCIFDEQRAIQMDSARADRRGRDPARRRSAIARRFWIISACCKRATT